MAGKIRLHQYLIQTGQFETKREVFDAIDQGKISIDGEIVTNPDYHVKPTKRKIMIQGEATEWSGERVYLVINKPVGYLSSRLAGNDYKQNKKSVFSLLKGMDKRIANSLFCAGRLDEDTSGLLVMTNDGKLIHKVTLPESGVPKTYSVELKHPLSKEQRLILQQGVWITVDEDERKVRYKTRPCKIHMTGKNSVTISVDEGKKREVRKIFATTGNAVEKLQRIKIGELRLSELGLKEGHYKIMEEKEIKEKLFSRKF